MDIRSSTTEGRRSGGGAARNPALATALSLLLMALLAPFAQFAVLKTLIVPADAAATTSHIAGSLGLFVAAIVAFLAVAILDVVAAGGFVVLLQPVHARAARVVGGLRLVYAAIFVVAILGLVEIARLVAGASAADLRAAPFQVRVAASAASFDTTWRVALGIFGLHLIGLGGLLSRFPAPRPLAVLVVLAGAGYLADALGTAFVAGYTLSISTATFIGEALLIAWLFRLAVTSSRSTSPAGPADGAIDHATAAAQS